LASNGAAELAQARLRLEPAQFTFVQLAEARDVVLNTVPGSLLTLLDIDERLNRLEIGVPTAEDIQIVSGLVEATSLQRGIVEIGVVTVQPEQTLADHDRPLRGGLRITYDSAGVTKGCTLTALTEYQSNNNCMVTNTHCSETWAAVDQQ
jgi:hypothetical protein